jgi:hypothetical protein
MKPIPEKFVSAEQIHSIQAMDHSKALARNIAVDIFFTLVMSI